jgi:hypothetical protein
MREEKPVSARGQSILRKPLFYSFFLMLLIAVYVGWILLSRVFLNRAYEKRVRAEQSEKQRRSDEAAIEQLGGRELAIQMLYATPEVRRGQTAQVCFGVANATTVRLEPENPRIWPSHNLCVDVKPRKTTTYTLVATGADGKTLDEQVTVKVR